MKEIEEKKEKLDGLEAVGADIDTVKTQLEDYKVFCLCEYTTAVKQVPFEYFFCRSGRKY